MTDLDICYHGFPPTEHCPICHLEPRHYDHPRPVFMHDHTGEHVEVIEVGDPWSVLVCDEHGTRFNTTFELLTICPEDL